MLLFLITKTFLFQFQLKHVLTTTQQRIAPFSTRKTIKKWAFAPRPVDKAKEGPALRAQEQTAQIR
jgi:hypothetical protein